MLNLAGLPEVAKIFGVSRQRAHELYEQGKLPKPLGKIPSATGRKRPIWRESEIRRVQRERAEVGS